tara:strand:+ start:249 stop:407 length:159 start_codon:yes stop_codon:yes gene_type:complete
MKTIKKISSIFIGFLCGGLISHFILEIPLDIVLASNLSLATGYLYGFFTAKN